MNRKESNEILIGREITLKIVSEKEVKEWRGKEDF